MAEGVAYVHAEVGRADTTVVVAQACRSLKVEGRQSIAHRGGERG